MSQSHDRNDGDDELEHARDLLERTVRFLEQCARDPRAAVEAEDPRDLIQGLRSLGVGPGPAQAPAATPGPRAIQIRRRRSA
jgi:hypothetical protein